MPAVRRRRLLATMLSHLIDYSVAIAALPLIGLAAVAIKLANLICGDSGPLFYRDRRLGLECYHFRMWKFRSLVVGSDGGPDVQPGDPRVTPVGRFIRSTRIDELPQFLNVLAGHMTVVGPRPISRVSFDRLDDALIGRYIENWSVRPGITSLADLKYHTVPAAEQRLICDAYYLKHRSIWLDLYIMLRTPLIMLDRRGVH